MDPTYLDQRDRVGLWIITGVALLSAISVALLLGYLIFFKLIKNALDYGLEPLNNAGPHYFINLLIFDILMALGASMDAKWAIDGVVAPGAYCTTQAIVKQLGNVGVAWTTTLIAIHSLTEYNQVIDEHPHRTGLIRMFVIWAGLVFLIVIPIKVNSNYYGPAGKWCWITTHWKTQQIVAEYMWLWVCAGLSLSIYVIIWLRANERLMGAFGTQGIWVGIRRPGRSGLGCGIFEIPERRPQPPGDNIADTVGQGNGHVILGRRGSQARHAPNVEAGPIPEVVAPRARQARRLMWYPLAYTVIIVPQSLIRLIQFDRHVDMPIWATGLGASIFALSGLVNVGLYLAGFRHFGFPEPRRREQVQGNPPNHHLNNAIYA